MGQSPWPFCAGTAGWWLSGRIHLQLCFWLSQWCSLPPPIQRGLDPLDLQRLCLSWGHMALMGLHGHVGPWASLYRRSFHPLLFRQNEDNAEIGTWSGCCKRPWRPLFRVQGPRLPPAAAPQGCDWPTLLSEWWLQLPSLEDWRQCWRRRECNSHPGATGDLMTYVWLTSSIIFRRTVWPSKRIRKPRWSWRPTCPRFAHHPIAKLFSGERSRRGSLAPSLVQILLPPLLDWWRICWH